MDELIRVGALARIDPEPDEEIAAWQADLAVGSIDDPEETRQRLAAYARGEQLIVRLDLFADVLDGGQVLRYDGARVKGAWFEVGADEVNSAHARELVTGCLDALALELMTCHGLDVSADRLAGAPVAIELDDELARRLGA